MPVILAIRRLQQEDPELEASLGDIASQYLSVSISTHLKKIYNEESNFQPD